MWFREVKVSHCTMVKILLPSFMEWTFFVDHPSERPVLTAVRILRPAKPEAMFWWESSFSGCSFCQVFGAKLTLTVFLLLGDPLLLRQQALLTTSLFLGLDFASKKWGSRNKAELPGTIHLLNKVHVMEELWGEWCNIKIQKKTAGSTWMVHATFISYIYIPILIYVYIILYYIENLKHSKYILWIATGVIGLWEKSA